MGTTFITLTNNIIDTQALSTMCHFGWVHAVACYVFNNSCEILNNALKQEKWRLGKNNYKNLILCASTYIQANLEKPLYSYSKGFEHGSDSRLCSMIVWVKRTVVGDTLQSLQYFVLWLLSYCKQMPMGNLDMLIKSDIFVVVAFHCYCGFNEANS